MSKMTEESKTDHPGVCIDQNHLSCRHRGLKDGWMYRDQVEEDAHEFPVSHDQSQLMIV